MDKQAVKNNALQALPARHWNKTMYVKYKKLVSNHT